MFLAVQIKVRARLKVCNWLARHVWNSQMSMKSKKVVKVQAVEGLLPTALSQQLNGDLGAELCLLDELLGP